MLDSSLDICLSACLYSAGQSPSNESQVEASQVNS